MMTIQTKYFDVDLINNSPTGKTKCFQVLTKDRSIVLGQIKWFGRWRKYCYYPATEIVLDPQCLISLSEILQNLTKQHKQK